MPLGLARIVRTHELGRTPSGSAVFRRPAGGQGDSDARGHSMSASADPQVWGPPDHPLELVARNVSSRYLAIFIDGVIGLILLPFNVSHLGPAAYGLWALTTSVTWFFGVLDLGYGSALGT